MRKKKHAGERIEACGNLLIKEPCTMMGNWEKISGGKNICLEIGCGKGTFICESAKKHPKKFFVAMEKVRDVLVMAMEKAKRDEISNIAFMDADAENICKIFAENEVCEIYLNFSDPWPKARHAKRRLTYRTFLERYKTVLNSQGVIYFKTDNRGLFDFSLEELRYCNFALSDITYDLHNSEYNENNIQTEYEKNFSAKGFSINRVVARVQ